MNNIKKILRILWKIIYGIVLVLGIAFAALWYLFGGKLWISMGRMDT